MEKYGLYTSLKRLPETPDEAARFVTEQLLPLHKESWEKEKQPLYGREYDPNIAAIMQMWLGGFLKIVMQYSGETPVGYLLALEFRPITHNIRMLQIEDWYVVPDYRGRGEKILFSYVQEMASMTGCHEIHLAEQGDNAPPLDAARWKERMPPITMRCFVAQ